MRSDQKLKKIVASRLKIDHFYLSVFVFWGWGRGTLWRQKQTRGEINEDKKNLGLVSTASLQVA
jgi:hypothetical protein